MPRCGCRASFSRLGRTVTHDLDISVALLFMRLKEAVTTSRPTPHRRKAFCLSLAAQKRFTLYPQMVLISWGLFWGACDPVPLG